MCASQVALAALPPQGRRPHAHCCLLSPPAAAGCRYCRRPAGDRIRRTAFAYRAGPRAGESQHGHPQRTPAVGRADPHRGTAQGRHRFARGHRLLPRGRADQRPAGGEQLPELQHQRSAAAGPSRCLQPAVVRWHSTVVHAGQCVWAGTDSRRLRRPHRSGQGWWFVAVRAGRRSRCHQSGSAAAGAAAAMCRRAWMF